MDDYDGIFFWRLHQEGQQSLRQEGYMDGVRRCFGSHPYQGQAPFYRLSVGLLPGLVGYELINQSIPKVVENLFVDRNHVRVVASAPTSDPFLSFACSARIALPTPCHCCSSAPPCHVGTFHRDQGWGR